MLSIPADVSENYYFQQCSVTKSSKKFKFAGNNIRTVSRPDLSVSVQCVRWRCDTRGDQGVTVRTSFSHIDVTPSSTGVFEVHKY